MDKSPEYFEFVLFYLIIKSVQKLKSQEQIHRVLQVILRDLKLCYKLKFKDIVGSGKF